MPILDVADAAELVVFEAAYTPIPSVDPSSAAITCNSCGTQLTDTHPGYTKGTPPQTPVICDGCGFEGQRIKL